MGGAAERPQKHGAVAFFDRGGGGPSQEFSSVAHVNKTIYLSKWLYVWKTQK